MEEKSNFEIRFEGRYRDGSAPWEIGRPQPLILDLWEKGAFQGDILDVGCGTGENTLFLASKGHSVFGVDLSATAIEQAQTKARTRKQDVEFHVGNALQLASLNRVFDTLLDSAVFHVFTDAERPAYAESLAHVLKPSGRLYVVCFSEKEPPGWGPRRVPQKEIRDTFKQYFKIDSIQEATYQTLMKPEPIQAWLSSLIRF
ncbi:MAG TPA: class I SAM-dependent methyltransferase [bacterium]|nr:class I SAM-dependent methyltransferase [bacterium]